MKRALLLTILVGCSSNAGTPVNEQVMYGGVFKTSQMRLADQEFVAAAKRDFSTPRAASDHYADLGWAFIRRGDLRTAIRRFNQCWLLDESNPTCFWGFGTFEQQQSHTGKAIEYLEKAQGMMPSASVDLSVDLATTYAQKSQEPASDPALPGQLMDKANALFQRASAAEPDNQKVPCVWAMVLLQTHDTRRACQVVDRCKDDRDGVRKQLTCP